LNTVAELDLLFPETDLRKGQMFGFATSQECQEASPAGKQDISSSVGGVEVSTNQRDAATHTSADGTLKSNMSNNVDEESSADSRYIPDIDDYSKDESEISLVLLKEVITTNSENDVVSEPAEGAQAWVEHLRTCNEFSSFCKTKGIEILKLNRRNKWQSRFLTVSIETIFLKQPGGGLVHYPKALLWVKRFSANHTYSVSAIDSEGRGGVAFSRISEVSLEENSETNPPKSFPKFKNSVQVNLYYTVTCEGGKTRNLAIRFKTKADAEFFISSVEAITYIFEADDASQMS
jgi:hypothetical protein